MMASPNKTILVIGKNGQLARSIAKVAIEFRELNVTFSDRSDLDLSDIESIDNYFSNNRYDIIVNAAAYTAVDEAEVEREQADLINHQAVKKLSEIALQHDSVLVHISTDYVFDGKSNTPYIEEDATNPTSVYGKTKLLGEQAMLKISPKGCIIRTSWLYSEFGDNFVKSIVQLGLLRDEVDVVYDQVSSPTYAVDLAKAVMIIVQSGKMEAIITPPIYHYSNDGICSWFDLASNALDIANIDCNVRPITSDQFKSKAKRPNYSVLNKEKSISETGIATHYWRTSLKNCLKIICVGLDVN